MRLLALLAAGLFAGTVYSADDKKDDKKKDEELLLGTWKVDKFDGGEGAPSPPAEVIEKVRMTFKKDGKLTTTEPGDKQSEAEFKLDSAAKPKALDITKDKDKETALGIYELDGDTLKLCIAGGKSKTRPTEFKADGKGVVVITMKRVKEEKKEK